jgi:CheY-like chemotaxis protein
LIPGGDEAILLVEDRSPSAADLVQPGAEGILRVEAENGVEALRLWEEQGGRFDLLLTDMVMPGGLTAFSSP